MSTLNPDKAAARAASDKQNVRAAEIPQAQLVTPLEDGELPDQLADHTLKAEDRQEALLDEGLEESFPSSDPVSVKRIT